MNPTCRLNSTLPALPSQLRQCVGFFVLFFLQVQYFILLSADVHLSLTMMTVKSGVLIYTCRPNPTPTVLLLQYFPVLNATCRPNLTLPVLPSLPAGSWGGQCRPQPSPDTHPCPWWWPAVCSSPLSPAGRCPSASSPPPSAAAAPSPWPLASSQPSPDRGTVRCQ